MTSPRDRLLREVATRFLGQRARIVAPVMVLALVTLGLSGAPRPQLIGIGTGFALMLVFFQLEAVQSRKQLFSALRVRRSLQLTLLGITLGCVATGGLGSPVLPMLFAPVVVGLAAFGIGRAHLALPSSVLLSFAAITLATVVSPFPPIPAPHRHVMAGAALLDALLLVHVGVGAFTRAHAALVDELSRAREGLLHDALSRTRSVESLGTKVAHEIKNPLASIRGLVELLAERIEEPRDARRLEVLRGEVQRLETLVHEYLTLARPLDEIRPAWRDLSGIGEEACALLEGRALAADVALTWSRPAAPIQAAVDEHRLLLVLLNLLVNAIEATPAGGHVELRLTEDVDAPRFVILDDGHGIAADLWARLGQAYVTTKSGGTGLGVALAQRIVEQHGGTLGFAPGEPRGTIVTVTLTRSPTSTPAPPPRP